MNSKELAWKIRRGAVELVNAAHASHIASILSIADIVAVLYSGVLNVDPRDPAMPGRDRFVLSKGHGGLAVYCALSATGFFPEEMLRTYYRDGSALSGHISHRGVPGVEFSTGALGHGACVAAGMALAAKRDGKKHRVFSITGDGECDEGSIWEMALFASHFKLDNYTVIVDHNKMQSIDYCSKTIDLLDLGAKFRSFGWEVTEADGHNHARLKNVLSAAGSGKPRCVIAHTVKGKGVSFMENDIKWHYRTPEGEEYEKAVKELEAARP